MRHKILTVFILLFGFTFMVKPVYSENIELLDKTVIEENISEEANDEHAITTTPKTANIIEQSAASPYENDLKETVTPKPKQELFKVLNMFMKAMLLVIVSLIIIYVGLLFYKQKGPNKTDSEAQTLKAPNNEDDALKNFLNKTQ